MSKDFLFELGMEELPSGSVAPLAESLAYQLTSALTQAQLNYGSVKTYATPRRIAVYIQGIDESQPLQKIAKRGPACHVALDEHGQPTQALLGFAKSCGVKFDELTILKTEKGEWWYYESTKRGAKTEIILADIVKQAAKRVDIPKTMRWGMGEHEFIRPVHWVLLLWGEKVIPCNIFGIESSGESFGHRFHHPQAFIVSAPGQYESAMQQAYVVADFSKRRQMIIDQVHALASSHGFIPIMPDALVDEVTSIVEWPQALFANFEPEFLEVPPEALIAAQQTHQKCFALQDDDGNLVPHFITVANIASQSPENVISGNEKVMRARLSDAAFFFQQDKRQPLSDYMPQAAKVIFQEKLGSMQDKALRIKALMEHLILPLELNSNHVERAAQLCKCDLMTGMVGEFPELQGLMGYYYARHDGEPLEVAHALYEQYMPRFSGDKLPQTNLGLALSLADRIDTLTGIFAIGKKPSGVKDPFKLRRHALAIVRMLIAIPAQINLSTLLESGLHAYEKKIKIMPNVMQELQSFILDRMHAYYVHQGIHADVMHAVLARQVEWLFDVNKRIHALVHFMNLPQALSLSAACKRVNNILQRNNVTLAQTEVQLERLTDSAEKALFDHIESMEEQVEKLYINGDYIAILTQLAGLRESIDAFFEQVMVMVDDQELRSNRLNLLARLQALLQGVADISLLTWPHE